MTETLQGKPGDPRPAARSPECIRGGAHTPAAHDSAALHVAGEAVYTDDIREPAGLLEVYIALAPVARADVLGLDLDEVRRFPGVACVVGPDDIPGLNDIAPTGSGDEPVFASSEVRFHGQPLFAVAADDAKLARKAASLAKPVFGEARAPVLGFDQARERGEYVWPVGRMRRGDPETALRDAPRRLSGRITSGGQDHFYLEGQVAMAVPGEDGDVLVHSSTQHPSEVQHMVAKVLGLPDHGVTVEVRRMGGGFGGKETQANLFAVVAALVAAKTGRPAKCRADRDDDMVMTGKRHEFQTDYEVGFDDEGRIGAVVMDIHSRCGHSADLSGAVTDRALFHADNAYFYPHAALTGHPLRTDTVSNTAFRGFGGPQGVLAAERVIEEVAFATGLDPLEVRKRNLYGTDGDGRNVTPYHMEVTDNVLPELIGQLEETSGYWQRRDQIRAWNAENRWFKRGLALTPVKFGISFTLTAYNQAGALLHVYKDGSVMLNHGGTEMGQGLNLKVAQVVAEELQIDLDRVKITATSTGKVPNTSATAASSGSDLNGMAAQAAARRVKERLVNFVAERHQTTADKVAWLPGRVVVDGRSEVPFNELIGQAYMARVQLSATGFYKTPDIHWDRAQGRGRPFYYFAYGAACTEAVVDTLTGEYRIERVDILHDVGRSLNPAVDLGQIEGGYVQGMGWLTTEELWWDEKGELKTHAPSTYKIPACSDRPAKFNVELFDNANAEPTVRRSKAVGEPPLMLATSALHAISDAVAAVGDHKACPRIDPPATPERVLDAIERVRGATGR